MGEGHGQRRSRIFPKGPERVCVVGHHLGSQISNFPLSSSQTPPPSRVMMIFFLPLSPILLLSQHCLRVFKRARTGHFSCA